MKNFVMDCNTKRANKRTSEAIGSPSKRSKSESHEEILSKNWEIACEKVSGNQYFDYRERFQLVYLPSCVRTNCNHKKYGEIKQIPTYAEESFMTEIRNHEWDDALEVCHMSLTPTRYLSTCVLQEIFEIIMNVHEDRFSEYSSKYIINNCQQVLQQNFSTHPPCLDKPLRDCYIRFLTSSMPPKKHTSTNRNNYEHNKGIIKYCMNRLECELDASVEDGPLIEPYIPENLKDSVKGYSWQKQTFEIFESLSRKERIERLFAVLESVVELLQFDLAIAISRYSNDQIRHMRCDKLMDHVLWPENSTKIVNNNSLQIIRLFANLVDLQYPDAMVKIITTWLNLTVQTLYARVNKSNSNYPYITSDLVHFGSQFYDIIADKSHDSIIRILERIEPAFMRHIVGLYYIEKGLCIKNSCIFDTVKKFVSESQWALYTPNNADIKLSEKLSYRPVKVINKISYLISKCSLTPPESTDSCSYPKKESKKSIVKVSADRNHVIHTLYITLHAAIDEIKLQNVDYIWNALNMQSLNESLLPRSPFCGYTLSTGGKTRYKKRLEDMKELAFIFNDLKNRGLLPNDLNIFANIELLKLHI